MKKYVFRSEKHRDLTKVYAVGVPDFERSYAAYAVHLGDIKSTFEAMLEQRRTDGQPVPDPITAEEEFALTGIDHSLEPGHYFFELAIEAPL